MAKSPFCNCFVCDLPFQCTPPRFLSPEVYPVSRTFTREHVSTGCSLVIALPATHCADNRQRTRVPLSRMIAYGMTYRTKCAIRTVSGPPSASALTKARRERVAAALLSPSRTSQIARFVITHSTSGTSPASSASFWAVLKPAAALEKSPASLLHDALRHHARARRMGSS